MKNEYLKKGRVKQKQETREKILFYTQELMNYGEKFTLEDVAEKAGISRATIYRYYSNIDILSAEAGIDINTKSPKTIYENLQGIEIKDKLLGVQEYYNNLALDNENAFRNYLSIVITSGSQHSKRGARRTKTLKMVLDEANIKKKEIKNIQNLFTVMMGIEPLIITKDVCGLNNEESKKLLKWGMELLLKGLSIDQRK